MASVPPHYAAGQGSRDRRERGGRGGWDDGGWDDGWSAATPVHAGAGRGAPAASQGVGVPRRGPAGGTAALPPLPRTMDPRPRERGLSSGVALVVLLVIAGIGAAIDSLSGTGVSGGFNVAIIVASIVAILLVRRSGMFPIVIAPPIVYSVASAAMLYLRSNGLDDHKALYDAASNWLVYGFPAIAGATAAVLIIAGVRLLARR